MVATLVWLWTGPAAAAGPPEATAEVLHGQAIEAYNRDDLDQAERLWLQAEQVAPSWRYSLNLAKVYHYRRQFDRCWRWADQTHQRQRPGAPADDEAHLAAIRADCERKMLREHALVTIACDEPARAAAIEVVWDGEPLQLPATRWTRRAESRLVARWNGVVIHDAALPHPAGRRVEHAVNTRAAMASLVITGTPAGAPVWVDGVRAGTLPSVTVADLPPGPHTVRVQAPAHAELVEKLQLAPGARRSLHLELASTAPVVTAKPLSRLAVAGWTNLGLGLALMGVGGGLVGHAFTLQSDLEELNALAGSGGLAPDAYLARYDEAAGEQALMYPAGVTTLSLGGALTLSSVIMLLLDGD